MGAADKKISELAHGTAPDGSELIPAVQGGHTVYLTAAEIAALGGAVSNYTDLGDAATADLPGLNTPLANALAGKADALAPGAAITGSGNLSHASHANRYVPATGAGGYTLDLRTDALFGAVADDSIEIDNQTAGTITLAATGGTLMVPTGYTATAAAGTILRV